ncbi:MAG: FISUMP domain-containing protein [Bacteroidales bacterium]
MKALLLSFLFIATALNASAQDIRVNFSGSGAATTVDRVTATNLSTGDSVQLPGNETLVLTPRTGISTDPLLSFGGRVFPNPFASRTSLKTFTQTPQEVHIRVYHQLGQLVAQVSHNLQPGENEFDISVHKAGLYLVSVNTETGTATYKILCTGSSGIENQIQFAGSASVGYPGTDRLLKVQQNGYTLGYRAGDIIHYVCESGDFTTIHTDSPKSSKTYDVGFAACTDAGGKNYPIVKIGNQTWMAQNMAYLPLVSRSQYGSTTEYFYYVYDYEDSWPTFAMTYPAYAMHGVLYNWPAARDVCPAGWHLPTDDDWSWLEYYLVYVQTDIPGKAVAARSGWEESIFEEAVGNNQDKNNSTGLSLSAGGERRTVQGAANYGYFGGLGKDANYWSSTPSDDGQYYKSRWLFFNNRGFGTSSKLPSHGLSVRCIKDE